MEQLSVLKKLFYFLLSFFLKMQAGTEERQGSWNNESRAIMAWPRRAAKRTSVPKVAKETSISLASVNSQSEDEEDEKHEKQCRYCLLGEEEGSLIAPCKCKGGQKWVHEKCLRKWQRQSLLLKKTHPWFEEQIKEKNELRYQKEEKCNICGAKFSIAAPNFDELVRGMTGEEIVSKVKVGYMIVRTEETSKQDWEIYRNNSHIPDIATGLRPWIDGVYLITNIMLSNKSSGEDHVWAVNLTRELPQAPVNFQQQKARIIGNKKVRVRHFNSGPMEGLHAIGCLHATDRSDIEKLPYFEILDELSDWLVVSGDVQYVVDISHEDWMREASYLTKAAVGPVPAPPYRLVYVCWGDGCWSRTQLIGEIARGGWGMSIFRASDVFPIPGHLVPPAPVDLFKRIHSARPSRVQAAGSNEMSRAYEEEKTFIAERELFDTDTEKAKKHREKLRAQLLARNAAKKTNKSEKSDAQKEEIKNIETSDIV